MFRFGREAARSTFLVSRASLDAETAERSFRTKAWMRELARGMDSLTLPVMATVARENGKKVGGAESFLLNRIPRNTLVLPRVSWLQSLVDHSCRVCRRHSHFEARSAAAIRISASQSECQSTSFAAIMVVAR
jgi:hypothetical protein